MSNKLFKSFFALAMVVGSALGFVACEKEGDNVVDNPTVDLSTTSLNFSMEEGTETFNVVANADWKTECDADWVTITPASGNGDAKITVAVSANDTGEIRKTTIKVIALHKEYGNWDTKKISVTQSSSTEAPVTEELIYSDNFDGEEATKTYGSGSSWPYIDQFPQFANPEGPAAENVTYSGKGVSVRANSTSDSQYSDYAGSGSNNIFFGSSAYFQVNNITLAEGQQNLKLTFGSEKYTQDGDSIFKNEEFRIYVSKDGNAWAEIEEYTFAGTEGGRWNVATAEFTLNAVPETLYLKFAASVASVYRLDDVKLYVGNGGQAIDLDNIEAPQPVEAKKVTVAEFLAAAEDSTIYELTGEITNVTNTTYGNFYLNDGTGEVLIYGLCSPSGEQKYWAESGAKVGDTITVQTVRSSYNGTPQGKDAIFVSLVPGEGGGDEPTPEPAEGPYASDVAFVCSTDDSTNAVYSLGTTTINGSAATGFKLGKGKQTGLFKSAAVGVSGDKYLNLYAVAWKGGDAKLYFRVDGGATQTLEIAPNDGATGNPPFTALTFAASDHYSVKLTGLTATSTIEFSTDPNFELTSADATISYARAIVCGVKLTDEALGDEGGNETPEPTPGDTMTIADVLAKGEGATIGGIIEGVVISNMDLNNLTSKKGMYVQDETGALQFYLAANHEFAFGTKVKIDLTTATLGSYNGAVQVSGVALDKITVVSTGNAVEAKTVSMADFLANKYEGQYIALEGVQVAASDLSKTWVMGGAHTSIAMEDAAGNSFVVFSSKYASYGAETVAQGAGTIKRISSISNGAIQIIFAQSSDYAGLNGERLGNAGGETPEPEPTPGEVQKLTVAEFLAAAEGDTVYELTGVIKNVANTNYGNFDLQDETGTVYVYGIYDADGNKVFTSLGLKEGDTLTMRGVRTSYNDEPQVGSGVYVSHVVGETPEAPANSATLSFADVANRTSFSTEQQVWEQNGVKLTNDKAASTSNVADYSAPARFYQSSSLKVEGEKAMTKIEFACNSGTYATNLQNSITSGTVTVDGSIVTVTLPAAATSYSVASLAKQVRMNSLTVYYE